MRRVCSFAVRSGAGLAAVVAAFSVVLATVGVAGAFAAPKQAVSAFGVGAVGTQTGGVLSSPRGVAVNATGAGGVAAGSVYVVDGANHRVQQFTSAGVFVRAWGQDVVTGGTTGFEVCEVAADCKIGITTAQTGGALNNPQGVAVDQSDGSVYVTDQGNRRVQKFTATGGFVWAAGWDVLTGGVTTFETCTVAASCKVAASNGADAGRFTTAQGNITVDPVTHGVVVADPGNRRIQRFSSAGAFVSTTGWDVVPAGQPGDVGVALETCPAASASIASPVACRAGQTTAPGNSDGQFGSGGASRVATTTTGATYVLDNVRIQRFDPGDLAATPFNSPALFGTPAPTNLALASSQSAADGIYAYKQTTGGTEQRVLRLDTAGSVVDTAGDGGTLPAANGLAIDQINGNIYLPVGTTNATSQVLILGEAPSSQATIEPVDAVAAHTATVHGVLPASALPLTYNFEYRLEDGSWQATPSVTAAPSASTTPVSASLTDLLANTHYEVRLLVRKAFNPPAAPSDTATLTTQPAPPDVTAPSTDHIDVGATSVVVHGDIAPNYSPTTYRFEYGPTTDYGAQTPAVDAPVPGGGSPTHVTRQIDGLVAGTTYHLRLVAVNDAGTNASADVAFTVPATPRASGRAFELVTPADAQPYTVSTWFINGRNAGFAARRRISTPDGSSAAFVLEVNGTLPGMANDGDGPDPVIAKRTVGPDAGWTWSAPLGDLTGARSGIGIVLLADLAADGQAALLDVTHQDNKRAVSPVDPVSGQPLDQTTGGSSLYRVGADGGVDYVTGKYGPDGPVPRTDGQAVEYIGGSSDLTTTYFVTAGGLLPGVPDGGQKLYRHDASGTYLVNRKYDGVAGSFSISAVEPSRPGSVSADGETVTFTGPGNAAVANSANNNLVAGDTNTVSDVYQVRDEAVTWISNTEYGGAPQTPAARTFEGASDTGDRVLLSTAERIAGNGVDSGDLDSAIDIYAYDAASPAGQRLSLVSAADPSCALAAPDPCTPNAASTVVTTLSTAKYVTNSADGRRVFFITGDVLNPVDTDAQQSLYARDVVAGTTTYIAPAGGGASTAANGTDAGTSTNRSLVAVPAKSRPIRVSADGAVAAFLLATDVTLAADRGGADTDSVRDLYVWRAGDGLRRVRQGAEPDVNTPQVPSLGCITPDVLNGVTNRAVAPACRGISDGPDGVTVYTQTEDRLTPDDSNDVTDVYAYHTATGELELVSPGDTAERSEYYDNDEDGTTVSIATAATLDPTRDTDGGYSDVYAARIGGGFPPLEAPPVCDPLVDACASPPAAPPPLISGGSGALASDGLWPPAAARSVRVGKLSAGARLRWAKTGSAVLSLRVVGGGTVTVTATGKVSGRTRRLATASRRVTRRTATTVRVKLRLSPGARSALARTGRLAVTIAASLPDAARQQATVTLKRAKARKRQSPRQGGRS